MAKRKRERRKPGSGYTTAAPNQTWSAFFPKRPSGYHVRKGFRTRALAEAWLDSLGQQRADKQDVSSGQQRVGVWVDRWIERSGRERGWKAKMLADVLYKLGYVKPYLGAVALSDVLPDDVDAMMDDLAHDLAENTIRQIRNYLFQVFESAVKRRYIAFNPVIKPERRKRAEQKPTQRLTVAETRRVLREAEPSFYSLAWWLVFTLGLRAGEVCGLRWGDIDLDKATVSVLQEWTDLRGTPYRDTPKGSKTRLLPLPRALAAPLAAHKQDCARRAAQGQQKGYWQENGLVFPGRGGRPMHTTSLRHQLKRMTDACHLPPITAHEGRHTAAKFYTDAGATQELTGAILGHGPRTITGHYAPHDAEVLRPWVEKVYRALAGEVERIEKEA
jgi:integrase